jgi:hypothetical protein
LDYEEEKSLPFNSLYCGRFFYFNSRLGFPGMAILEIVFHFTSVLANVGVHAFLCVFLRLAFILPSF